MNLDDRGRAALANARALLAAMAADGVARLHIVTDGFEVFIGRGGEPDPLMQALPRAPLPEVAAPSTVAVTAPHVGTVENVAPVGSLIPPGGEVARLRVLDTSHSIASDRGGRVARACASVGDLVEYGAVLVDMAEGA